MKTRVDGAALQIGGAPSEPLFHSIGAAQAGLGVDGAAGSWRRVPVEDDSPARLWDQCHELVRGGLGVAGSVELAEPDLTQRWTWTPPGELALSLAAACDAQRPASTDYPTLPDPYWFRDAGHSDFGAPNANAGEGARIAHLDTGYDPTHGTVPPHLDRDRQCNFVDAGRPRDASDTADGAFSQHGHGTATLALAGSAAYGGAPGAAIIPMRVANSVVLFSNLSLIHI